MKKQEIKIKKIKAGDIVRVLLGKDRGKSGKVLKVLPKKGRALVEGVNVYKRHIKAKSGVEGGIIDITKTMNVSNLSLVCAKCKQTTRVGFKLDGDKKIRICRRCGGEI